MTGRHALHVGEKFKRATLEYTISNLFGIISLLFRLDDAGG